MDIVKVMNDAINSEITKVKSKSWEQGASEMLQFIRDVIDRTPAGVSAEEIISRISVTHGHIASWLTMTPEEVKQAENAIFGASRRAA